MKSIFRKSSSAAAVDAKKEKRFFDLLTFVRAIQKTLPDRPVPDPGY